MPTRVMNKGVDEIYSGDRRLLVGKKVMFEDVKERSGKKDLVKNSYFKNVSSSEESSSIGKNSDLSENSSERSGDGEEVQSSYKGPLDDMEALEEVLPIRRGISRFYNGKSKSYASLADASASSSIKDIAKRDNGYIRKRRSLLSYNLNWDRTRSSPLRGNGGGISKRVTSSSRTTLAVAVAMSISESDKQAGECSFAAGSLPRKYFSSWRSFSLADLQEGAAVAILNSSGIATNKS